MAQFPDDYFKDITSNITSEDKIKAGYKIPKYTCGETGTNQMKQPKTLDTKTLRGDLNGVIFPVPMNFSEGGMFSDAADRISFSKPINTNVSNHHILSIENDNVTSHQSIIIKPKDDQLTIIKPKDDQLTIIKPEDKQLTNQTHNNPFRNDPMIDLSNKCEPVNIGENQLILGRGPNNVFGRPGFYAGIFKNRFGSYPTQPIRYDSDSVFETDKTGQYIDFIGQQKQPLLDAQSKQTLLIEQTQNEPNIQKQPDTTSDQLTDIAVMGEVSPQQEPAKKISDDLTMSPTGEFPQTAQSREDLVQTTNLTEGKRSDQIEHTQLQEIRESELVMSLTNRLTDLEAVVAELKETIAKQEEEISNQSKWSWCQIL